ncbi:MAG TPA: fatty acid hydroxylase [Candidatus Taylorbacteria bacterium]|nr:MAG: Fatty acid hydroxylase [Parcubacteria group bacterium GW2011_GWA2_47_64]KKU96460.1 MAG: Fatty acid hydroxylase [Parcubacteria group bacterium GW2011_GWC2_48_17]HBV01320.1 fatty acid hydroxylase [Candidatus Taylorbacteria bacterium]
MLITIVLTALFAIPYASFFEWTLHRFLMHRPIGRFDYAYKAHALVHHRIFKADHTYHLMKEEDKRTIPMAWWNGFALVLISGIPFDLIGWYLGTWAVPITAALTIYAYYGVYEYLHWCMHLPKRRGVERTGVFFRLNGHHVLHHRYMGKNFNVVLPLADLCLGTLLLRSKVAFAQVKGDTVPNLQPREHTRRDMFVSV